MIFIQRLPEIVLFVSAVLLSVGATPLGTIFVAVVLALFLLLAVVHRQAFLTTLLRWWPLLLVPALCAVSTLWSSAPPISLRYGLQLFLTVLLALFIARLMTPRRFLLVLFAASFVFCVLSLGLGRQGPSAEGMVPIGLTGSKNQFAYFGQLLLATGIGVLTLKGVGPGFKLAALLSLPMAALILIVTKSATAQLTALLGAMLFLTFVFMQKTNRAGRLAAIVGAALLITPLTLLTTEAVDLAQTFQTQVLRKDTTLTGRTYLWERAEELIRDRPVSGHGYRAAWMGESTLTRGLLDWAGIQSGRGFHFHNNYFELAVDIGLIGAAIFALTLAASLAAAARQFYMNPTAPTSFFFALLLMLALRTFTDLIYSPLSLHAILFTACCSYAFLRTEAAPAQSAPVSARRPLASRYA